MSDDRLFHRRLGHSQKVNALSDLEEIVWRTYIQAADDFGVMIFTALDLRREHDRLMRRTDAVVQRMFERLRDVGLIHTFEHQGRIYSCQWDWQDWQKVRYPLRTIHPRVPAYLLTKFSPSTQWLFSVWPGGGGRETKLPTWTPPRDWQPPDWSIVENIEETKRPFRNVPERSATFRPPRAGARVARYSFPSPTPVPSPFPIRTDESPNLPPPEARRALHPVDNPDEPTTSAAHPGPDPIPAALCDRDGDPDSRPDDRRRRVGGTDQAPCAGARVHVSGGSDGDHASDHPGRTGGGATPGAAADPGNRDRDCVTVDAAAVDTGGSRSPGADALRATMRALDAQFARTAVAIAGRRGGRRDSARAAAVAAPADRRGEGPASTAVTPHDDGVGTPCAAGAGGRR